MCMMLNNLNSSVTNYYMDAKLKFYKKKQKKYLKKYDYILQNIKKLF